MPYEDFESQVEVLDILLSSERYLGISVKSISRKRDDCFKIIITTTIYYVEHRQTYPNIVPIPSAAVVNYDTDPETIYTKDHIVEYVWGEDLYAAVYTNLVTIIQTDINGFMKEEYISKNIQGAINTLEDNVYYSEDWEP